MLEQLLPVLLPLGGPGAAIIYLIWDRSRETARADRERDRADVLTERMFVQSKEYLEEAARREASTLSQLEAIVAFIKGRQS